MYCSRCGKQNREDAVFCRYCGTPLYQPQQQGPCQQAPQGQTPPYSKYRQAPVSTPPKKKHRALPWIIVGAVAAAAAIALILILTLGGRGGFSDPEEAALEFYKGAMFRDFDRSVGVIYPELVENMGENMLKELREECDSLAREEKKSHTTYDHFVIKYVEHIPEEVESLEKHSLEAYHTKIHVEDLYAVTINCDCIINGEIQKYAMQETIGVFKIGGRWYAWPEA